MNADLAAVDGRGEVLVENIAFICAEVNDEIIIVGLAVGMKLGAETDRILEAGAVDFNG